MLTSDEIRIAYQLFLGREPENEDIVESWLTRDYTDLRREFLCSREFKSNHPEIFEPAKFLPLYMRAEAPWIISRAEVHPVIKNHALNIVLFGYTVISGTFSNKTCEQIIEKFRKFEQDNPKVFNEVRLANSRLPRIVNLHLVIPELLFLFTQNTVLLAVQDFLFSKPTSLYTSLFYEQGSEQPAHRDTPVFCTRPEYLYFGNTVYLEAADESNGCLEVVECGHLIGEPDREEIALNKYGSLENIPTLDNELWIEYQGEIERRCNAVNLTTRKLRVSAGDTVIWHPQLPHGGSAIMQTDKSRRSLVFHTTPVGTPVYHQDAFFNPAGAFPAQPRWAYRDVHGRAIAEHPNGISFGEPLHREIPFSDLIVR